MTAARRVVGDFEALDLATIRWTEEYASYGLVTLDPAGCVRRWNRWMVTHTGRSAPEVVGRKLFDVFPDLVARDLARYFDDASKGKVGFVSQRLHGYLIEMPTDCGAGRFERMQQSAQIGPLVYEGRGVGVVATITDVTERVAREADLRAELATRGQRLLDERAARETADASNRMKDEFLAVLSHELRTPLHAISGWAQVLREGRLTPEKVSQGIAAIERNAQMQTQLVEDLLDASRIISGNLEIDLKSVHLGRAIEAAVDVIRPAAEAKGLRLSVELDPDVGSVRGDPGRVQQIVLNLLSNAVKFTPGGGSVDIVASSSETHAAFTVIDSGHGITREFLPHVFERFRQSDSSATRAQGGLGLGLSLVKRLVELHDGTVTAASGGAGLGATFVVTLPRADAHRVTPWPIAIADTLVAPQVSTATLEGIRILFVDDDDDGREIMALALSIEGAEVTVAASAAAARATLVDDLPSILVSDIGMPGEDGHAFLRSIRTTMPHLADMPAIALTGYAGLDDQRRAREAGFAAHLTKPVDLAELVTTITRLTHR